ncbi:MAG: UvrD-helicase domain-containing protein [Gemmatimonadetes bacterium]|nr:UvrD-helicase domain-containing protein [Gemmatimonadota bacterium]NIQ52833.1 UvrD-helicase domain-containing protein [Gemmatimonadota bacterium]NIU72963.1 UvrD-helicase domain-containing protein [Gammaproteobacteria bacterium]NIX43318.1 UvrD-helicase domain-containing protein [Gemmatimonadota bacterium]NIY07488.1 UvrD-helicase domain-containing protein [Gemmatimonadota bacterium]
MRSDQSHLRGLNPEQRQAVLHTDGPVLVLAGAGSGKTKMLVHRISHLIRSGKAEPRQILAVTFTNKAAREMRERVAAFAGDAAADVVISTFHSLGVRILREHGEALGLPRRFAIYDTRDQLGALKTAAAEVHIDDDRFDPHRVLRRISDWKTRGVTPSAARREVMAEPTRGDRSDDYAVLSADAYGKYQEVLRACGAVDFDDLLLLPVRLLEEDEEVRRAVWKRWRYVMIDEYQDTNGVQLDLARHLAGGRRNLCVVGDDDQSIYAFRGADVRNILEFERHFPGAEVIQLVQNYRSTKRILAAANAIIRGNPHRHEKTLRTDNPIGPPIDLYEHEDEVAEAETVAKEIGLRRYRHGTRWSDYAVLYRTNAQGRVLEEALREKGTPYRVVGGTGFFDRKEIADGVAYLRAVAHPDDEIAVRRIINFPTRGIGRTTVMRVAELARSRRTGFCRMLTQVGDDDVGAAQARAIAAFQALLDRARRQLRKAEEHTATHPPGSKLTPIAEWALELFRNGSGLIDAVADDEHRVHNLKDLVGAIARYERKRWADRPDAEQAYEGRPVLAPEGWEPPTLHDALARLALDQEEDDEEDDDTDAVVLMTLHSAKGLEFDEVFLVGLEEGILPHSRSIDEAPAGDPLAEERRLLYVGLTRARTRVTLSRCLTRKRGGEAVETLPSRYLDDLPDEHVNLKSADAILTPEESAELRQNFFKDMKEMLEG